jgi:glycosyltransferase involved in cell wall biosynthesis
MEVAVFLDQRFLRTPDGTVWTADSCSYSFFRRYLEVFDHVRAVARVRDAAAADPRWKTASGAGVSFTAAPHYVGPLEYLRHAHGVKRAAHQALQDAPAVILRVPSQISNCIEPVLRQTRRPYAVEVVGDPFDSYAPGAVRHPLRPFLRRWFRRRLRAQCAAAAGASYVTAAALQQRYPCAPDAFTANYSSVELPPEAFADEPRSFSPKKPLQLISVGSLQFPYKGFDLLIRALRSCRDDGLEVSLEIVGDGPLRGVLEAQGVVLEVDGHVRFAGSVSPGQGVRTRLDQADLYVHASRAEGLPRALIEAMARGLPCVASRAGGVAELLPLEDTVPVGDAPALARKISEVLRDPGCLARMSARNLTRASDYEDATLGLRRNQFYANLREATAACGNVRRSRLIG